MPCSMSVCGDDAIDPEDDCAEMLDANELSERFEEDYEDDGQPTWEQEWEDFGECYE